MSAVPAETDAIRRLARVEALEMRVGLVCERLLDAPDEEALAFVEATHRAAALGSSEGQLVFLAVGWALFEPRMSERRHDLGVAARRNGMQEVADFVAPLPAVDAGEENARRIPDFGRGRPLTLGERKSLARTHDRQLIQRVVRDPHPDVIRILLDNPSLVEDDVVRVCATRPNDPEVLRTVYRHRRWVVRYRPRNAILRNPDTPVDIGLVLAPLLRKSELKEAATSSELAAALRLSCRAILDLRTSPQDESVEPID